MRGFWMRMALLALVGATPAQANKPLIGVACEGGFYVRAPTQKIYWIHGDPLEKTVVYDGADKLMALAECGKGTVAVFQSTDQSQVYFSSNCLNIGAEGGNTQLVHSSAEPVTALEVDGEQLVITHASGSVHAPEICQQSSQRQD